MTHGPPGGIAYAYAFDPQVNGTVYAGTLDGVFVSRNHGATWASISNGLPDAPRVGAIAVDSEAHQTLYASVLSTTTNTGDVYGTGDGGRSWTNLTADLSIQGSYAVALDPIHPGTIYAGGLGTPSQLFRSTDHGASWMDITGPITSPVLSIAVDPIQSSTIYVGVSGSPTPVYKSTDGGVTLVPASTGIRSGAAGQALRIDPATHPRSTWRRRTSACT